MHLQLYDDTALSVLSPQLDNGHNYADQTTLTASACIRSEVL